MHPPNQTPCWKPAQDNEQASSFPPHEGHPRATTLQPDLIEEFQKACHQEYGQDISRGQADEGLNRLMTFYKMALGLGEDWLDTTDASGTAYHHHHHSEERP